MEFLHREDHLPQVRPMILTVTVTSDALAALTFNVDGGRIEKHQSHFTEEVSAPVNEIVPQVKDSSGLLLWQPHGGGLSARW